MFVAWISEVKISKISHVLFLNATDSWTQFQLNWANLSGFSVGKSVTVYSGLHVSNHQKHQHKSGEGFSGISRTGKALPTASHTSWAPFLNTLKVEFAG